jgi:hypothetical protein
MKRLVRPVLTPAILLLASSATVAAAPPAGTISTSWFCGTLEQVDSLLSDHGIRAGDPFVGRLNLIQRNPDSGSSTTHWDCVNGAGPCGEFELELAGFAPPQTAPQTAEVHGPVSSITQSVVTYHLVADLDGFVAGASGTGDLTLLCPGCPANNDPDEIKPTFPDQSPEWLGTLDLTLQVPGIGGGTEADASGVVLTLGSSCRNFLPSSSPLGLVALVVLMIAAALLFAKRRAEAL